MSKIAVFTMDVEAFYQIECLKNKNVDKNIIMEDGIDNYLELLDKYQIKSDLFVVTSLVSKINKQLTKAFNNGHKINIHGLTHTSPLFQSKEEFKNDIEASKKIILDEFKESPIGYRAPCFYLDNFKLEDLPSYGLAYDSSYVDSRFIYYENKLNIKDFSKIDTNIYKFGDFYEFCLPVYKKVPIGGGGYARLLPFITYKKYLKRFLANHDLFIFYVHPFELSNCDIPKIKGLNFFKRSYLKHNRKQYLNRIEKIIQILKKNNFDFRTFEDIIATFDICSNEKVKSKILDGIKTPSNECLNIDKVKW